MQDLERLNGRPLSYEPVDRLPWDRTVDIVCHSHQHDEIIPVTSLDDVLDAAILEVVFPEHLPVDRVNGKKKKGYKDLPPSVRRKIWGYLIKDHSTPVTLSHLAFTRAAWSLDSLTPFHEAYTSIQNYIAISPLIRIDVLLTFLSVNTFHVTLSPHVGPRVSPLATKWLVKYGAWMEKMILEVDMSKLGFGGAEGAEMLTPGLDGVMALVRDIAVSQGERKMPLRELTLLCRRYYGEREGAWSETSSTRSSYNSNGSLESNSSSNRSNNTSNDSRHLYAPSRSPEVDFSHAAHSSNLLSGADNTTLHRHGFSPLSPLSPPPLQPSKYYCHNYHLPLLNPLYQPLHTKVHSLRMCGFSEKYTHALIKAMFPSANSRCVFRLGPSNGAWPRLIGQRSWIDDGTGEVMIDVVEEGDDDAARGFVWMGTEMPPRPVRDANGGLVLPSAEKRKSDSGTKRSSRSVKTTSTGDSTKTMSKGKRLKKFLAGAGGKSESMRDSGSSKGSKEGTLELMSELPGYL